MYLIVLTTKLANFTVKSSCLREYKTFGFVALIVISCNMCLLFFMSGL